MTETERAVEQVRDICAGIAEALAASVSRGADRLRDFDRGEIAAAKHIARRIREIKFPAAGGPRTGMTEGG